MRRPPEAHRRPGCDQALPALAFACLLAGLVWLGSFAGAAGAAGAAGLSDLRDRSQDARGEVERLSQELRDGRARFDAAQAEADSAATREAELSTLLAHGEERSAELGEALEASRERLRSERRRLARATAALAARLVAIYKSGMPDTTELVLGSADFSHMASGVEYFEALREADTELAARVRQVRNEVRRNARRQAELARREAAHNARLASARDSIASVRLAAESSAAELAAINSGREGEIDRLRTDLDALASRIQTAEAAREQRISREEAEEQVAQYYGGPYAIPTYIVMCESGGDYSALNPSSGAGGAYQILPSTWEAYGGEGLPHEASKEEQDRIAALIWADSGGSAWVCAG